MTPRTQAERDAERLDHQPRTWHAGTKYETVVCNGCSYWQDDSIEVEHPCPVILALDDADELAKERDRLLDVIREAREALIGEHEIAKRYGWAGPVNEAIDEALAILSASEGEK